VILPFASSIFSTLCRKIFSSALVSMAGETVNHLRDIGGVKTCHSLNNSLKKNLHKKLDSTINLVLSNFDDLVKSLL
jgi:hypothetical protein